MLELIHVSKRYGGTTAVDDISFCARAGEVTGYLGANASGKSTTMKMLTGLLAPSAAQVLFAGTEWLRFAVAIWGASALRRSADEGVAFTDEEAEKVVSLRLDLP